MEALRFPRLTMTAAGTGRRHSLALMVAHVSVPGSTNATVHVSVAEQKGSSNWVMSILRVGSIWKKEKEKAVGENVGEFLMGDDRNGECDECCCAVGEEMNGIEFDRESFSKLLRKVPMVQIEVYANLCYLGSLAYNISAIKRANLLKQHGLRYITSSLERKAESSQIDHQPLKKDSTLKVEEIQSENNGELRTFTAYDIAASAASCIQCQAKERNNDINQCKSDMASFVATTNSVTAVVAGKEEMKKAVADDLNSSHSSPSEWFICDDDKNGTRYFVIQGSESLASWQTNLLFEPVQFEGFDMFVHRGIYEAAKGIYDQMLPAINAHLNARGSHATLRFTGHSLGGSLALLINLMLLIREEVPLSSLLPVITFGAPSIMCGGDYLFQRLGLPRSHVQAITLHRDIVPRAFSCSYPDHVAKILKAVNGNFRNHPCLEHQKLLYAPMGEFLILQPEEDVSPHHHLLPPGSGLYLLSHSIQSFENSENSKILLRDAQHTFLNSPHPLEILSDRSAYGAEGSVYRDHDMNTYLRSILDVLKKRKRDFGHMSWAPLVYSRGDDVIIGRKTRLNNPAHCKFRFAGLFNGRKESLIGIGSLFVVLLVPAKLLVMGTLSMFGR